MVVYESGDPTAGPNDLGRDGWGGRLARAAGGNVVSMTGQVRQFCNGPHPDNPGQHDNRHVITARDTRQIALYHAPELARDPASRDGRAVLSRALTSYYAAKADTVPASSAYAPFIQHERIYRELGGRVEARLEELPLPAAIEALFDEAGTPLDSPLFGRQVRNVFDSFACADIFGFRVGSLMYDGWDTHKWQVNVIEPKFDDLFGDGKGLDVLFSELQVTQPDAADHTVVVLGGEFGRQLRDNGDGGTDHGRANTVVLIGAGVRGGLYGELFPDGERARFAAPSGDIDGKTSIDRLFAAVSEWVEPGSAARVFPDLSGATLEDGVSLDSLFV